MGGEEYTTFEKENGIKEKSLELIGMVARVTIWPCVVGRRQTPKKKEEWEGSKNDERKNKKDNTADEK